MSSSVDGGAVNRSDVLPPGDDPYRDSPQTVVVESLAAAFNEVPYIP